MEASLYDEGSAKSARRTPGEPDLKKLKSSMTLDFGSSNPSKSVKLGGLLGSPDLNLLKLASPELERMIISQNGLVTTTPTPTQFLFPKAVTEEQQDFARGFVDALAELHKTQGPAVTQGQQKPELTVLEPSKPIYQQTAITDSISSTTVSSARPIEITPVSHPSGFVGQQQHHTISTAEFTDLQSAMPGRTMQLKEEPQTVPCLSNSPAMSPLQPIDMESQETIKMERKRARNRVAARKCRTRKLERISRLEERVDELKGQNADLCQTATQLREQVCALKKQIMTHVNSGCHVMLSPNLL